MSSGYHEQAGSERSVDTGHEETPWREQETAQVVSTEERSEKSSAPYSHALSQAWPSPYPWPLFDPFS